MPKATIVVPAYNVASTIKDTLNSLIQQTYSDFEILIIDDGSTDNTAEVVAPYLKDARVRYVKQANRGLAGARNTGIRKATGLYVGFCDADDLWDADKLRQHVRHFERNTYVGISYAGSRLIDEAGTPVGIAQSPRLKNVEAHHILKRNPIGNGSAAMFRREVFETIGFRHPAGSRHLCFFDERFRQSEDIECWLRIALTTDWVFEGIPGHLTDYRVVGGGLSANTERQLASWENVINKLRPLDPAFFAEHEAAARSYQYRYLARRAVSDGQGQVAMRYVREAAGASFAPLIEEPRKTLTTLAGALFAYSFGQNPLDVLRAVQLRFTQ